MLTLKFWPTQNLPTLGYNQCLKGYFVVQNIKMKNDWIALMQIYQSFSNYNNDAHLLTLILKIL